MLPDLADYERFIYTLPALYRTIQRSTLVVVRHGAAYAELAGTIFFNDEIALEVWEDLDFATGVISGYSYAVNQRGNRLYWYDPQPHPNDPTLASTHPHHKHIPPDIKRHRIPAPGLSFSQPNLPFLITEIESNLQEQPMPVDPYLPDNQWLALTRLEAELPALVNAEAQQSVAAALPGLAARLAPANDEATRLVAALDLQDLIAPHPAARRRFLSELHIQAGLQAMFSDNLHAQAAELGVAAAAVQPSLALLLSAVHAELAESVQPGDQPRLVKIGVGGRDGGQVVRLRNLTIDFKALLTLLAGVTLTRADILSAPDPLTVLAGVFLIIRGLVDGLVIELGADEASVFWGFIQVCGRDRRAGEAEIVEWTNKERAVRQLNPLAAGQVAASLKRLVQLGALRQVNGVWKLDDEYRITSQHNLA